MIEQLKYGDMLSVVGSLQMVKNVYKIKNIYEITIKDMSTGKQRVELLDENMIKKLKIEKIKLTYLNENQQHYYFKNEQTGEILKYTLPFIGSDIEYLKKEKIKDFKQTTKPVMINRCSNNLKKGDIITLSCKTPQAKIYYTLDGTEPDFNSMIYKSPIIVESDFTIKAFAVRKDYIRSYIQTFDIRLSNKKIKIYLSPSRQSYNKGHKESLYSNEMIEMNKVCDYLYNILKDYDVILYRNNPDTYIEDWVTEGHYYNVDLHLAIHSNGTVGSWKKGIENWIHDAYSPTYSLAQKVYDDLYAIYPYHDNPFTNRGVKYAKGAIAEANPAYVDFGMNLEIAYHDNLEDANFIVENRELIAKTIANSLIEYYNLKHK